MYCKNCGQKIEEKDAFCVKCGEPVIKEEKTDDTPIQVEVNNPGSIESKERVPVKKKLEPIMSFISKHKKQLIIGGSCLAVIVLVVILFFLFYDSTKIDWNKSYKSLSLEYITQSKVKLGYTISNEEKDNQIKISTNCGEYKKEGKEITWDLTDSKGKCEITLAYKSKKLKKEVTVLSPDIQEKPLAFDYKIDLDSDEDLDYDGLTNKQEKEYGTNPELADSDMDGLDDYYEIFTSKTNPNKADTDGDGLNDYDEIELKLDPNNPDTKGDGIKDGERTLTYNYKSDNITLAIKGKGNIASVVAEVNSNTKISKKAGLIDNLYTLYTDGKVEEATLTIHYTDKELQERNIKEDNLSIYYYNESTSKYEKVDSVLDKQNKTVTAKLKHFSNYVVGDTSIVKESTTNQVIFILDNSWSMYTDEQYEKYTGKKYNGGLFGSSKLDGFDADGVRFSLTSTLTSNLSSKGFQIGLSEFRRDYKNALPIGSDADDIKKKLTTMEGSFITKSEGTNISNALTSGMKEFSSDTDNKYIILLTDGQDSYLKSNSKRIIDAAVDKDIKICAIGFGSGSYNTELANISNATGCKFFSSSDANGLTELFNNMETELTDDLVDIDGDNEADGILLADSGFIVNRDGFSFENYTSNLTGGHCYGMATFAELYYLKKLPLKLSSVTNKKNTSFAYDLTKTYFKNQTANLYDYKLKTNELKYQFGFDYFDEEAPEDFKIVDNNVYTWKEDYKKIIEESGLYDITRSKTSLSSEKQLEKYGVTYEEADNLNLNEDRMQNSTIIHKEDKQLLNAIYASFIKQNSTSHISSSMNLVLYLRDLFNTENISYSGETKFINILKSRLASGDPVVINGDFYGLHAINAINLIQDLENPNYYYIGVYDNNFPGEKRYVDLECKKDKCVIKPNAYYNAAERGSDPSGPLRITASLEFDLNYYEPYIQK